VRSHEPAHDPVKMLHFTANRLNALLHHAYIIAKKREKVKGGKTLKMSLFCGFEGIGDPPKCLAIDG
jgi:hypothetical protein